MRYLLILLVLLAMAAPAWSQCGTPNKHLGPFADNQLPQSLGPYSVTDCDSLDWEWDFVRTESTPSVGIQMKIDGSSWSQNFACSNYDPGKSFKSNGSAVVTDTSAPIENTLEMSLIGLNTGCFNNIDLYARNYR